MSRQWVIQQKLLYFMKLLHSLGSLTYNCVEGRQGNLARGNSINQAISNEKMAPKWVTLVHLAPVSGTQTLITPNRRVCIDAYAHDLSSFQNAHSILRKFIWMMLKHVWVPQKQKNPAVIVKCARQEGKAICCAEGGLVGPHQAWGAVTAWCEESPRHLSREGERADLNRGHSCYEFWTV